MIIKINSEQANTESEGKAEEKEPDCYDRTSSSGS